MTRSLALMAALGGTAGAAGLATLALPRPIARLLRLETAEASPYILRIAGMMVLALGLFLTGFAVVATMAGVA